MNDEGFDTAGTREVGACRADRDLDAFVAALRDAYPAASCDHCEADHVSHMLQEAHLLAERGEPVVRPASKANGPAEQVSGLSKWRRDVKSKLAGMSLGMKAGAGAMALVFAFTGVAFAGGFPRPVQHAVSGAAAAIGIQLPDPEVEDAVTPVDTAVPAAEEIESIEADDVDEMDVDENDQDEDDAEEARSADDDEDDDGDSEEARSADDDDEDDAEEARSADDDDDDDDEADEADERYSDDHESDDVEDDEADSDD